MKYKSCFHMATFSAHHIADCNLDTAKFYLYPFLKIDVYLMLFLSHSIQIDDLFSHQRKNYKDRRMHLESCLSSPLDIFLRDLLIKCLNYTSINAQAFLFFRLAFFSGSNRKLPMNYVRFYLQFQQIVEI